MFSPLSRTSGWLGLAGVAALAALATQAAAIPAVAKVGLSPLTLAIVFGILLGNTAFSRVAPFCGDGVDFCKNVLLRAGIILYGFRITVQQVLAVGWQGLVADTVVLCSIFSLALALGRWLRVDRHTAVLIGAGSGICGAAAVMATEPVVKAEPAKVSVAIATVVLFGTVAMFSYPLLMAPLGLSAPAYGLYVGATVHEVAQVVAAGNAVGEQAASVAVIVKMLRVMMLAPFLVVVSLFFGPRPGGGAGEVASAGAALHAPSLGARLRQVNVPWFAVAFLGTSALYSTGVVPATAVSSIVWLDTALLAMAMGALGLRTHASSLRAAGARPMVLAFLLLLVQMGGGAVLAKGLGAVP